MTIKLEVVQENMVRKDQNILKDNQTLKGIQALMLLAQEGASKMDRFAKVNLDKHKPVSGLKEYTDLPHTSLDLKPHATAKGDPPLQPCQ
jgi:hypothetical protein